MDHFNNIRIPREIVSQFFICFAKFEFALKTTGFSVGNDKRVSPDWDKFGKSISKSFDKTKSKELEQAVDFYLNNPPWKQVLIDGGMAWDSSMPYNNLSEIEKILLLVRRVRNNLFHGGKFNIEVHEKRERAERLLKYGLIILESCLSLDAGVQHSFVNATI